LQIDLYLLFKSKKIYLILKILHAKFWELEKAVKTVSFDVYETFSFVTAKIFDFCTQQTQVFVCFAFSKISIKK